MAGKRGPEVRVGTSDNGMDYAAWGTAGRTALFLPGGPGSTVPHGVWERMAGRQLAPYLDAGYSAWMVTRRRGMPPGHTVADIADDYASFIADHLDGHADLVVGTSFGGMVALHLAANHPQRLGLLALVASGARLSAWCADVDRRMAEALRRGDETEAATIFGEYVVPTHRGGLLRRLLAPTFKGVLLPDHDSAHADALVELDAESRCDARPLLPRVDAPTLVLAGDRDRIFPFDDVLADVRLVPDCEVRRFPGRGHVGMASSSRVPSEVLGFASRH